MPVEIELEMYGEKEVILPSFTGHVARGLLLHIVRQVDPNVSGLLHELDVSKPYSVVPLMFKSKTRIETGYVLDPAFPCRARFRFLKDDYSTFLLSFFQKQNTVLIFDTPFHIASLSVNGKSFEDLEKTSTPASTFRLYFKTPTYLASMGSSFHWMFPDAAKVFSSLMRCWNLFSDCRRFSKEELMEYKEWLSKNAGVSQYELWTKLAVMKTKKAAGFEGWATYEFRDCESSWCKVTCMLARYAEYANIGGNRAGGFGVTRLAMKP